MHMECENKRKSNTHNKLIRREDRYRKLPHVFISHGLKRKRIELNYLIKVHLLEDREHV